VDGQKLGEEIFNGDVVGREESVEPGNVVLFNILK
jgi:hypothetical protein